MQPPSNLPEVLQHLAKQQQEKLAADIAEAQQKLITVSYDKAASYTTVIIFGGYAGFFAIWQLSKEYLSRGQSLWSALLILISLLAFVLFEVLKMVLVSRSIFSRMATLRRPEVQSDPARLLQALRELDQTQHESLRGFMIAWATTVAIALGGALVGAGILGYAFITGLAK
jgi:hypothetical protein